MELGFISDTHNRHNDIDVGGGDIIFHSGDATGRGRSYEIEDFIEWYSKVNYCYKVFTPGNHDFGFEREYTKYKNMCEEAGIICLNDDYVTVEGLKIHGSPVTPWFHNWAFNRARNASEASLYGIDYIFPHWDLIPNDVDVLLTHGPPYEILDELVYPDGSPKGQFVGCEDLLKKVKEVKPKIHAFGHIHEGYGTHEEDGTLFINASSLDECYCPGNEIVKVEYVGGKAILR